MRFSPKTFHETVLQLIQGSDKNLELLIDAYLWAQAHLKEIHAVTPTYEQQWLVGEIRRIFNVNATDYVRTAKRLGGGAKPEQFESGKAFIRRFGVFETFRADRLLSEDHMRKVVESISEQDTIEDFRNQVDHFSSKLDRLAEDTKEKRPRDYKIECLRLESQVKKLQSENDRLKEENERLKEALSVIRSAERKALSV